MIRITSSIDIYRPVTTVFDFVSTAGNDFEWQYGTLASGPIDSEAAGPGATFRTIGHLMGQRMTGTFQVTQNDANRSYGFKSLSGPLHLNTLFTFELKNGMTRVNVATEANAANVLNVSERMLEKYLQKQLREDLAMLKSVLETQVKRTAPTVQ